MWNDQQLDEVSKIAVAAGQEILAIYDQDQDLEITLKDDKSPLTEADRRAHRLIVERLQRLDPDIPILSEESDAIDFETRNSWHRYWLVDPLDGTKEFIKRNGEFTVNIALIDGGQPGLGVVHVPVTGVTYLGKVGVGAWKQEASGDISVIAAQSLDLECGVVRVLTSRSHRGEEVEALIARIEAELSPCEVVSMGSSLKICLLADGSADIYPRLGPTCEWDTAAAHGVLAAAGGDIYTSGFQPLRYNQKAALLNSHFIALADIEFGWQQLLRASPAPALDKPG
ncbi:MAG TPA: 3'(2'),5'-bisphosphate nucleotidase CysQ [Gammaproteobacteria bacterium]|jgi:3'(2'), 5'-bisphosphate nucleotidase|nr:3'(2'),5'-bisphosphate nucleotidase CysQ [Gammaproteobacteria bacterium]HIL62398.1 3'(2'),5'-bisphosphate nucleotidase [Porticoccaceae bacterium]|tara:strand:- start:2476 stop:3327 length:852 start_codon:yes stop_codon:yes gene_type:complete